MLLVNVSFMVAELCAFVTGVILATLALLQAKVVPAVAELPV